MKRISLYVLLVISLICACTHAQIVNPIRRPIRDGPRVMKTRLFAQIPEWEGGPSRINHITHFDEDIYVCTEKSGGLIYKITPNGTVTLWADIARLVLRKTGRPMILRTTSPHAGLRSLAFHPNFARNGLFYVSFMERRPTGTNNLRYLSDVPNPIFADSVVAEFRFNFVNNRVMLNSYRQVIRIGMPVFDHPIKQIAFRGFYLYIAHGDGSVQSDVVGGGQRRNDALGKILRIIPIRLRNEPYRIPASNPFVNDPDTLSEIYALGFRNPHNICFSRRGELFVTEAGRDNVEEVNIVQRGRNYGWGRREGTFVHLEEGGVGTGVAPLPEDDARFGFTYPNAQVGHSAPQGNRFVGQALAGGCPIENGSENNGLFFYANFPVAGELYYSFLNDLRNAVVRGPPSSLTQARTYRARILFDQDNIPLTPPRRFNTLGGLVKSNAGLERSERVDVRFGQGPNGELYWSSKRTGEIYLVTSSVPE